MTARQVFDATLIELSKVQAPSLKLYEFNYLFNKAINQYINKVYNVYDINQQTTDDLRVLKSTAFLTPIKVQNGSNLALHNASQTGGAKVQVGVDGSSNPIYRTFDGQAQSALSKRHSSIQSLRGANYEVYLPIDYLHMLNCVCIYYVAKQKDCWDAGSYIEVPATRLVADSWSQIVTDIYNRPSPMRPYYYIHNENQKQAIPTDPYTPPTSNTPSTSNDQLGSGRDMNGTYHVTRMEGSGTLQQVSATTGDGQITSSYTNSTDAQNSNFQRTIKLEKAGGTFEEVSLVEKPIAARFGNTSNVRCEIRYGKDDTLFQLAEVQVDYVKCPQFIRLTQEQIDLTEDTSQIMEFPDYVNQEIINELVHLVMERVADPRLQTNMQISQSIARPAQQQQQTPAQQAD